MASPGEGPKDSEGLWLMAQHRVGGSFWVDEGGVGGEAREAVMVGEAGDLQLPARPPPSSPGLGWAGKRGPPFGAVSAPSLAFPGDSR